MLTSSTYRLGHWTFVPSANELRSGPDCVRLEQRASLTLSLLCERSGEVVSQSEIVERVWNRSHLSPNSVAVVIGDLRRALNLPTGSAGSIETLPKAGYRIVAGSEAAKTPARKRWPLFALIALLLLAAASFAFFKRSAVAAPPSVMVGQVDDQIGEPRYAPLIRACSAQLLVDLGKHLQPIEIGAADRGVRRSADYEIVQRWVLWTGDPELVLIAHDRSGKTIWSGAVYGPPEQFPAKIAAKIAEFDALVRKRSAGR